MKFPAFLRPIGLALALVGIAIPAQAQDENVEEVVVLGSRTPERSASETPVPVDVLSIADIQGTGQRETGRAIQFLAPSFNFPSSTVSDGTDALRPATLRGLSPDQTLVLVNGKRRHASALLHLNGSVGRGSAGVDMNAIPVGAIGRIEILRDGAAAQYGSDAIAGVINLELKNTTDGTLSVNYGQTGEGDGTTPHVWLNQGFEVGDGGFINYTLDVRDREATDRGGVDGTRYYPLLTHTDGVTTYFDEREFTVDRSQYKIGDADSQQYAAVVNFGLPIGNGELYAFGTYSSRENNSGGFYRRPSDFSRTVTDYYADGFLPQIMTMVDDFSAAVGYEFEVGTVHYDISATTGMNDYNFRVHNSINASAYGVEADGSPRASSLTTLDSDADAGTLSLENFLINFDVSQSFSAGSTTMTWAAGGEYRTEDYGITPGEEYSYVNYGGHNPNNCPENDEGENVCTPYSGGIQVFPGFQPVPVVDANGNVVNDSNGDPLTRAPGGDRNAIGLYGEIDIDFNNGFVLDVAGRYEDYSDFGDVLTFKVAGRYATESLTLRGSVSTGFRAPSLHQLYLSNVATLFVDGVPEQRGTFANDSYIAQVLGIPELTEEQSQSISFGLTYNAGAFSLTADLYQVDIDDRVSLSTNIVTDDLPQDVLDRVEAFGAQSAQFFTNAANTETTGLDLVIAYNWQFNNGSDLKLSVAHNSTDTNVVSVNLPTSLNALSPDLLFTPRDQNVIESWQPDSRTNIGVDYQSDSWSFSANVREYGNWQESNSRGTFVQTFSGKAIVDLNFVIPFGESFRLIAGADNLLDTLPDEQTGSLLSRAGPLTGNRLVNGVIEEVTVTDNANGIFVYPRGAAPWGINGAYYYVGFRYSF